MQPESVHLFQTLAIHGGRECDPATGAILTPIHQTTTYVQEAVGQDKGYTYSRSANPTVAALESALAALEEAPAAASFVTGMAAVTALALSYLGKGDHVICGEAVYGGTVRLFRQVLEGFGVEADFVDAADLEAVRAALRPQTKLCIVETPANPTLAHCDIEALAAFCDEKSILLAVDNTFLTPVLQRPLDLGAHFSIYSTTKFIEGHNTTVGGAIVARDESLLEPLRFVQNATGIAQSPFPAWLTLRGLKTLPLRMKAHSEAALRVARFLEGRKEVAQVLHPDLESFPQRELAARQQVAGGGVLAFELEGGVEAGKKLMASLELCSLAESLGAVETLITHPASMTHGDVPPEQRRAAGITDGLVRLSVGLERPEDIIADLERGLELLKGDRK